MWIYNQNNKVLSTYIFDALPKWYHNRKNNIFFLKLGGQISIQEEANLSKKKFSLRYNLYSIYYCIKLDWVTLVTMYKAKLNHLAKIAYYQV